MKIYLWTRTYKSFNHFNIYGKKTLTHTEMLQQRVRLLSVIWMGVRVVNLSLRFISDLILWGKGLGSLSDRLAPGPGRDSDISEGLPGEPLSPLIHPQTRGPYACPAPAMSPCLLGCVVFCLLQAGESWGSGSPSGCQH